jgi:hypothetical protein
MTPLVVLPGRRVPPNVCHPPIVLRTLDRRHWSKPMIENEAVSSGGASEQRTKEPPSDGAVLGLASLSCRRSGSVEYRSRHRPAADRAERPALGYGAHVPNHLNPMLKRFDGHLGETRAQ